MRVVVVGAVNVDLVVAAHRLPGPGETVVGAGVERQGGGKGANAAVAAARAGAQVSLIGAVGDDDEARRALADLAADGVDTAAVAVLTHEPTGVALIVVDDNGENQIAVGAGANGALSAEHVTAALERLLPDTGCVLVSTEVPGPAVTRAIELAVASDVACVLNPAPVTDEVVRLVRAGVILTPNASECRELAARLGMAEGDALAAATAIAAASGAPVAATVGASGSLIVRPGSGPVTLPAVPVDVRDTTGAGDTYNGVLAACLAAGRSLDDAVADATTAASLSVTAVGARSGMPTAEQVTAARRR